MKKIILALAVLLAVQVADAQTKSPADAKKAVEAAEAASQCLQTLVRQGSKLCSLTKKQTSTLLTPVLQKS